MPSVSIREKEFLHTLLVLTLNPSNSLEAVKLIAGLEPREREQWLALANSHHVVIRALRPLGPWALAHGDSALENWAAATVACERRRIQEALPQLEHICAEMENAGCPVAVIKSLDHWPDLGNDLDLFTTADERRVARVFEEKLSAEVEPRSWGDRLANKWNFRLPNLRESVEVHVRRLGQTGEHTTLARRFITRRVPAQFDGFTFHLPAPEERIIAATLQRMYRHFYFRVCDIANSAAVVEAQSLDYQELRAAAQPAGIWPGVASYLQIVSDYLRQYRGRGLELPQPAVAAARLGGDQVEARARFLRVPLIPHGARLYTFQVTQAALRGDVPATFRLTLLPYLASAAALAYRITGSDKGVW